ARSRLRHRIRRRRRPRTRRARGPWPPARRGSGVSASSGSFLGRTSRPGRLLDPPRPQDRISAGRTGRVDRAAPLRDDAGMPIEPDTKDWTWVLERACPECGVEAAAHSPATVPDVLRDAVVRWEAVLRRPDVSRRPDDATWSPLEYAAHVRDVCAVFRGRLALLLAEENPT